MADLPATVPQAIDLSATSRLLSWRTFLAGLLSGVLILCAGLATFLFLRPKHVEGVDRIDPSVYQLWGPMLKVGEEVDICVATPPALLLHAYKEGQLPGVGFTPPLYGAQRGLHLV